MTEEDVRAEPRRVAVRGEALRLKQLVEAFDSEASLTDQSAEGTGVWLPRWRLTSKPARWRAETACGDFDLQIYLSGLDGQWQSLLGPILEALPNFPRDDLGRLRR